MHPTDIPFGDCLTRFALPAHWDESAAACAGRIVAFDAAGCGSALVRCHDGSFAVVPVPALRSERTEP